MVSADKLIKVGVKYSDKYFETLKNIYNNAYRNNDSLEDFLNETKDYSIGNPLEAGGFKEQLTNLVVASTNDIRFSRPAQKALMNTIISNTTGELITNVGDDIKAGVRDIVSRGYREGKLNHNRVADEINSHLDGINRKRARTIARTEIKRAQTTSNYVVARERGANAYTYKCGAKPCDICIEDCGETFPIDDTEHLPPRHPNCMCGVSFFKDPSLPPADEQSTESTDETNINQPTKLLEGPYKKYTETTDSGRTVEVYKFKDIELAFETKGTAISFKELKSHIDNLPEGLQHTNVKRIEILSTTHNNLEYTGGSNSVSQAAGLYYSGRQLLRVFNTKGKSKEYALNVFNHEYAHAKDLNSKGVNKYSIPKVYEKYVKADNIHNYNDELKYIFSTEYGGKSYLREMNGPYLERVFLEDFADSSAKYLNSFTHDEFCEKFPNRAKYFEEIYGKPNFKNTLFTQSSNAGTEYTTDYHLKLLEKKYDEQLKDIDIQLGELKELRYKYKDNARNASTDEEADMWRSKQREVRVERKRLQKIRDEIDNEQYEVFKRRIN